MITVYWFFGCIFIQLSTGFVLEKVVPDVNNNHLIQNNLHDVEESVLVSPDQLLLVNNEEKSEKKALTEEVDAENVVTNRQNYMNQILHVKSAIDDNSVNLKGLEQDNTMMLRLNKIHKIIKEVLFNSERESDNVDIKENETLNVTNDVETEEHASADKTVIVEDRIKNIIINALPKVSLKEEAGGDYIKNEPLDVNIYNNAEVDDKNEFFSINHQEQNRKMLLKELNTTSHSNELVTKVSDPVKHNINDATTEPVISEERIILGKQTKEQALLEHMTPYYEHRIKSIIMDVLVKELQENINSGDKEKTGEEEKESITRSEEVNEDFPSSCGENNLVTDRSNDFIQSETNTESKSYLQNDVKELFIEMAEPMACVEEADRNARQAQTSFSKCTPLTNIPVSYMTPMFLSPAQQYLASLGYCFSPKNSMASPMVFFPCPQGPMPQLPTYTPVPFMPTSQLLTSSVPMEHVFSPQVPTNVPVNGPVKASGKVTIAAKFNDCCMNFAPKTISAASAPVSSMTSATMASAPLLSSFITSGPVSSVLTSSVCPSALPFVPISSIESSVPIASVPSFSSPVYSNPLISNCGTEKASFPVQARGKVTIVGHFDCCGCM